MRIFRIRLGLLQLMYRPYLVLILMPIVISTVFFWSRRNEIIYLFDAPEILFRIYRYSILTILIMLPFISLLIVIAGIGYFTARTDEANLQEAFKEDELRNGFPILINKKYDKKSKVIMREFYTEIPMSIWKKRQDDIADTMNVYFVEPFSYGGKANGRRIVMYTVKGRKRPVRGNLYDK